MELQYILIGAFLGLAALFFGMPVGPVMLVLGVVGGLSLAGTAYFGNFGTAIWSTLGSETFTAIPLFILMGELLLRTGFADGMYRGFSVLLGWLPGGLLHTNIGTCTLFSATSGSSVACAATVGTVALPALEKNNYNRRLSLGSLAAGGTLGILIPPSVNLLVYGGMMGTPIKSLFTAGIIPGLTLALLFMIYLLIASMFLREKPKKAQFEGADQLADKMDALLSLIPPLVIFGIIMGTIYTGIATPTESASYAVITTIVFAVFKRLKGGGRALNFKILHECLINSAKTTGMILFIIVCANILNSFIEYAGITHSIAAWVKSLGLSFYQLVFGLVVLYAVLGMFLDALSVQIATTPIIAPIVIAAGSDFVGISSPEVMEYYSIWFGIFLIVMCELGMITPPMGLNLFIINGIRKDTGTIKDTVIGALPFAGIMIFFVCFLIFFPQIAMFLTGLKI